MSFKLRHALRNVPPPEARAMITSLSAAGLVVGLLFAAYFLTGSAAIFSDAVEGIVNVVAAGFALYALAYAHQPADVEHPYGHGKIEFLSAGFEGGMILLAASVIIVQTIETFLRRSAPQQVMIGVWILAVVTILHSVLGIYLIGAGRKTGSIAIEADGRHLLSDAVTTAAALVALVIVRLTGWSHADPIAALLVAAYIASTALGLLRRSAAGLLDEQDKKDTMLLRRILDSHIAVPAAPAGPAGAGAPAAAQTPPKPAPKQPLICSYHKLRHRHSGRYHWVDFHLVVPAWWNVARGHEAASAIEYEIEQSLGEGNATAHIEPCMNPSCQSCKSAETGDEPPG